MSRRIEIEITSLNGDVATWRAAGAKLPKGVLSTSLVPGGPVVGTVYRADVEQFMEGMDRREHIRHEVEQLAAQLKTHRTELEAVEADLHARQMELREAPQHTQQLNKPQADI